MSVPWTQLLEAAYAGACFGALIYGVARSPTFGLAIILITAIATQSTAMPLLSGVIAAGSFSVYPFDVVAAVLLCVGLYRLATNEYAARELLPIGALLVLLLVHITWGAMRFGIEPSVTSSRVWIYFLATLLYAATVTQPWTSQAKTLLLAAAGVLSVIGLLRIAQYGFPSASRNLRIGGTTYSSRPIVAGGALVLLQALILAIGSRRRPTPGIVVLGGLLIGMIIVLQHRTVWAVAICVAPIAYWSWARDAPERPRNAVTGIAILSLPAIVIAFAHTSNLQASIETAGGPRSTFAWRVDSWHALTGQYDSIQDRLIGIPSGASLARQIDGITATESAHSLYVEALLAFGILGVVAIAGLWLAVLQRRNDAGLVFWVAGSVVIAIIASQVVFGITYSLSAVQGAILGILLSSAYRPGVPCQSTNNLGY